MEKCPHHQLRVELLETHEGSQGSLIADVYCVVCQTKGAVRIDPSDVNWDNEETA